MAEHHNDVQLIEITPNGVQYPRSDWARSWRKFKREMNQVVYLVRWRLMERTFGRILGPIWVILDPIIQSAVYFFILGAVFNIKGTDVSFLSIFLMITLWKLHANLIYGAPTLLTGQATILQQTNFPMSVILMEYFGNEICLFFMNFVIIVFVLALAGVYPNAAWLYLPFILVTQLAFTLLCTLIITGAGTFVRDLGTIVNVGTTMWFYGSPVVYSMERVGEPYRTVLELINPLCHILPAYRSVVFDGQVTEFFPLLGYLVASLIGLVIVLRVMDRVRNRVYQYL